MNEFEKFMRQNTMEILEQGANNELKNLSNQWITHPGLLRYSYHFSWLGRPIIQYPQDIIAMQEIIWKVKPDIIIETGIAHGGSLIFYASMLELLELCGNTSHSKIIGIDIDIRAHNKKAIIEHPLYLRGKIHMLQGSSIDPLLIAKVVNIAQKHEKILVILDSNHTHEHVLSELEAYAPLVSRGSYCVVFDTIVEQMPENAYPQRRWGRGDNPASAVAEFLKSHSEFAADTEIDDKLLISVAPGGYLKRL